MKKSIIALGALALCGSVVADVTSANTVGFMDQVKKQKNSFWGPMFVSIGQTGRYKLYDITVTSTQLNIGTKKNNYIQLVDPANAMFDSAHAYYWEPAAGAKPGFWAYKNLGPNKEAIGTKVPEDVDFAIGSGFFVSLPQNVKLTFSGEVYKPVVDADGYIAIAKPVVSGVTQKNFFFANPFPVAIKLTDLYFKSTQLNIGTKKNNYIQKPDSVNAMFDSTHAYYWEPAAGAKPGFWAYKNLGPNKEAIGTAVPDEEIGPGEGFFVSLPQNVTIMVKVPDAIKNL